MKVDQSGLQLISPSKQILEMRMITDPWNPSAGKCSACRSRETQQRQLGRNSKIREADGISNQTAVEVQAIGNGTQTAEHRRSLLLTEQFTKTAEPTTWQT